MAGFKDSYKILIRAIKVRAETAGWPEEIKIAQKTLLDDCRVTVDELRELINTAERQKFFRKEKICYRSPHTTPNRNLDSDFRDRPSRTHTVPWYKITPDKTNLKKLGEPTIPIKIIRLEKSDCCLIINNDKIVSFKSRRGEEEEKTKMFKILSFLWNERKEIKNGEMVKEGDLFRADDLKRNSGCDSVDAVLKQISRLNAKFVQEGLDIKIESYNNFQLVIKIK